jgi:DNA topoisomerase-1
VWICPFADGHVQATGRDAKGRKQYRYHPLFREVRESTKYEHVVAFADALPRIRTKVRRHMTLRGLPRKKVLATVVHLLETTLIRVGNDDYARQNKSFGLTTLRNRHAAVEGSEVRFRFIGKSGKQWSLKVKDRRVAKIIKACQELPGQDLLQYLDQDGKQQNVTSADVNAYLKEITGQDITAKDFRTWAGTVLAALALKEVESFDTAAQAKRNLRAAIERVAARLGNTPAICRKCYVHPEVLNSYLDGSLVLEIKSQVESELRDKLTGLQPEEAAVLALLRARLKQPLDRRPARNVVHRKPHAAAAA